MLKFLFLLLLVAIPTGASGKTGDSIKLSLVQFPIEGKQTPESLLGKLTAFVNEAKGAGSQVVLFPELVQLDLWPIGSEKTEKEILAEIAQTTPGILEKLPSLARRSGLTLVAGTYLRQSPKGLINSAAIVHPDGTLLLQDKIHLTPWEHKTGIVSGDTLSTFDIAGAKAVVLVCYDVESPEISHALGEMAPELFLIPSMTETAAGLDRVRWTAQARAVEHAAFVAVAGTVGKPSADFPNIGQGFFTGPRLDGFTHSVKQGPLNRKGLVTVEIPLKALRQVRSSPGVFHPAKQQTPFKLKVP